MTISTDLRRISALAIDGNCTPGDLAFLLDQAIIDVEELETNARLIAAAPTMLSALEQSRDFVIPPALRQIFDAAIAKAKS